MTSLEQLVTFKMPVMRKVLYGAAIGIEEEGEQKRLAISTVVSLVVVRD